jgi:hypothetical protein
VRTPPPKQAGKRTGKRRLNGDEVLDIPASASFFGDTEKGIRGKVARGLVPYHRLGGRIILLRSELTAYLAQLPGVTVAQALANVAARAGEAPPA